MNVSMYQIVMMSLLRCTVHIFTQTLCMHEMECPVPGGGGRVVQGTF